MSVIMYDCGFGDCFCIKNEYVDRPLFVDFGINTFSKVGKKDITYMAVLEDMQQILSEEGGQGVDFLLTHYHTDHFSGLMHLIRKRKSCRALQYIRFKNVYIPNVWNIKNSRDIVMALLLSYLPRHRKRKMNIFDFLMAICQTGGYIHLINRGCMIGNELIALWPPKSLAVADYLREINVINETFLRALSEITDELINVVLTSIMNQQYGDYSNALLRLKMLRARFYKLSQTAPDIDWDTEIGLNRFGNGVSIVFQNAHEENSMRNILFTGDVPQGAWNEIENLHQQDGIFLHQKYRIIKIPHHGTQAYYHDFRKYIYDSKKSKLLIPNGDMNKSGHEISSLYPNCFCGALICCSNNNNCEEKVYCRHCTCDSYQIVSPAPSFIIY